MLLSQIFTTDIQVTLHWHGIEGPGQKTEIHIKQVKEFEFILDRCAIIALLNQRMMSSTPIVCAVPIYQWLVFHQILLRYAMRLEMFILHLFFYYELVIILFVFDVIVCDRTRFH